MPLDQIGIALLGLTAIALVNSKGKCQRYGCLFGMASQPFWFWSSIKAEQWGIVALVACYTLLWGRGIWNNWIEPLIGKGRI